MGRIVWIASYPKSGNTWMRAFLANYYSHAGKPASLEEVSKFAVSESHPERYRQYAGGQDPASIPYERLAQVRPQVHAAIAAASPRTVFAKSHNYMGRFAGYPLHNLQATAGAVYIVRNPLDVAVSMMDHFGLNADEAIDFMANEETATPSNEFSVAEFLASWSTHVSSWTAQRHPNIVVLRYEDMLERPGKAFQAVLKLVNQPRDAKRMNQAIKQSSFRRLRSLEDQHGFGERSYHSRRFFRSGSRDQWRTVLSREQVERMIEEHEDQMKRFDYIPKRF